MINFDEIKHKKLIAIGIVILIILAIFIFNKFLSEAETTVNTQQAQVEIVPLSQAQVEKVASTLLTSEFIKDVPEKNPIALQFYDFQDGERIWQSGFLMGENELLTQGEPSVYLYLHSKYIEEIDNLNMCEVIKRANQNGDLGFYSEYNKVTLLIKYANMLKHRDCFGV